MSKVLLLLILVATSCVKPQAVPPTLIHPHSEILYWCWPADKTEATPTLEDKCANGEPSWYPQYGDPGDVIKVKADKYTYETAKTAVQQWNLVLGRERLLLLPMDTEEPGDIVVALELRRRCWETLDGNVWCVHGVAGMRKAAPEDTTYQGTVTIYLDGYLGVSVMAHEIGHCLGLRHDEDAPGTLMFPAVSRSGLPEPRDVAIVRRLHGWD